MLFKKFLLLIVLVTLAACSGAKDTTVMTPKEHFDYALEIYTDEDYQQALTEFQTILLQYPGSSVNDDAQYYLGMTYFNRDQFLLAAYEYSKLITNIPASPFVPMAQFQLAESYYQLSPPAPLEQSYSIKAIEEFQAFIDFFPMNPKVEESEKKIAELNEKLAEKQYNNAVIYGKMEYTKAAIQYYTDVVNNYHDTKYAPLALQNKIELLVQREQSREALESIAIFYNRYPNHPDLSKVKEIEESLIN
ncbi:MAG: outer membrane protein assembly factor BamD [Melioribacteraceae bacterium]|nr:outer membrane protein assembly factor BamD [Melioribacteraceae bacterium]MCF8265356.1 outer membrane protein assembly factor BamD [Melioribacteraceae bacterium]MCF8412657.1 outer membrane protein assembly factor BamD [Melioribacteraceae bacterium]MCF8430498.1 outer membrane protein assembly factor BamD [Melioribacteraceae bacterium]